MEATETPDRTLCGVNLETAPPSGAERAIQAILGVTRAQSRS